MQEVFDKLICELEGQANSYRKNYVSGKGNFEVLDGCVRGLEDAIEIVKQCGVDDDVCEWKHFSNDKSPYRPSCSQYMKSKFEAFKFGDYCPFCGKKIKVVE